MWIGVLVQDQKSHGRSCLPFFLLPPDCMSSNNKQLFVGFMISWQMDSMGNAPCSGAHLVSDYYICRRLDGWKRICHQKLDRAKSSSGFAGELRWASGSMGKIERWVSYSSTQRQTNCGWLGPDGQILLKVRTERERWGDEPSAALRESQQLVGGDNVKIQIKGHVGYCLLMRMQRNLLYKQYG